MTVVICREQDRHAVRKRTMRLIQDSTIDLVRPILSCNDQTSIKIAE
jgi:hypothetical protein